MRNLAKAIVKRVVKNRRHRFATQAEFEDFLQQDIDSERALKDRVREEWAALAAANARRASLEARRNISTQPTAPSQPPPPSAPTLFPRSFHKCA